MLLLILLVVFATKHCMPRQQLTDMAAGSNWSEEPQPVTTTPSGRIRRREDCLYVNDEDYYSVAD